MLVSHASSPAANKKKKKKKLARLGFVPSHDDIVMHIAASYAVAAPGLRSGTAAGPAGRSDWTDTGNERDELCGRTGLHRCGMHSVSHPSSTSRSGPSDTSL
jgi:hypothetical protein